MPVVVVTSQALEDASASRAEREAFAVLSKQDLSRATLAPDRAGRGASRDAGDAIPAGSPPADIITSSH